MENPAERLLAEQIDQNREMIALITDIKGTLVNFIWLLVIGVGLLGCAAAGVLLNAFTQLVLY